MSFSKLLVANRGEIACRIIRSARAMGYRSVAVYSDADAGALHVQQADEAVHIGPAPAAQSYLHIPALLQAARDSGADAVHPGYGFLSERADFARACIEAGLGWVGPPPAAIEAMGDKARAKQRMLAAGVPCVPGWMGDDQDHSKLAAQALALGLPVLVKAVAGGGGRGMRLVHRAEELPAALAGAQREAEQGFGDGRLMLEKLVEHGRHIEVQVFADAQGHCIHLGERDCTAQRRRQKVVEEAPSPVVNAALRDTLGRHAVAAAKAVGYVGAGTVEFIVDAGLNPFFLEMNTRLQVEHPVTEAITGLDLVAWQLRVAAGEPLPLRQEDIRFEGHAVEVRLYAEDPCDGFRPKTGTILHWQAPQQLRVDHGLAAGQIVTPHYDAMLAKLVAHGASRADALRQLDAALQDLVLVGPAHNAAYLRGLLRSPEFIEARMHTRLLDEWAEQPDHPLHRPPEPSAWLWCAAAALHCQGLAAVPAWRPAGLAGVDLSLRCGSRQQPMRVVAAGAAWQVRLQGQTQAVKVLETGAHHACVRVGSVQRRLGLHRDGPRLHLAEAGVSFVFDEPSPAPEAEAVADPQRACAAGAGTVGQVLVQPGQTVAAGQPMVSVEAMKMEIWVHAGAAGTVATVAVRPGQVVAAGALLVQLETS